MHPAKPDAAATRAFAVQEHLRRKLGRGIRLKVTFHGIGVLRELVECALKVSPDHIECLPAEPPSVGIR